MSKQNVQHAMYNSNNIYCYIACDETKRDWLIHGHVALDKCNVSLGQQVNNCCSLRPAVISLCYAHECFVL